MFNIHTLVPSLGPVPRQRSWVIHKNIPDNGMANGKGRRCQHHTRTCNGCWSARTWHCTCHPTVHMSFAWADIPSAPLLRQRRTAPTMTNLPLHVLMVWTDPPYHRSPLPGYPVDPHDPCKGLVQTRPVTETDVVAHPPC